jgi:hypothetical protein
MRISPTAVALSLATFALANAADAGNKAGVAMPETTMVAGKQLHLNGMGLREATWLKVDVYVAGLYVERVSSDADTLVTSNQTKLLVLRFVRDVDRPDIVKAWRDGFRNNAAAALPAIRRQTNLLDSWMVSFAKGDTLAFAYVPGEGVHVDINQRRKGTLQGEDFARSLFAIWLGPKPPNKSLKRGLLGDHGRR